MKVYFAFKFNYGDSLFYLFKNKRYLVIDKEVFVKRNQKIFCAYDYEYHTKRYCAYEIHDIDYWVDETSLKLP